MIDYFFKFTDEASAIADASGTIYYSAGFTLRSVVYPGTWNPYRTIPNLQVWRTSQDIGGVHSFLPGWFGMIMVPQTIPALTNHSALQLAIDREAISAGQPGILKCNVTAILQDLRFQPVPMGSQYPFGALT